MKDLFYEKYTRHIIEEQDKQLRKFLIKNGYKVPKIINDKYINKLRKQLENEDKFVDGFEWIDFDEESLTIKYHCVYFFNSISHPLSEEMRNEIIERYKNVKKN